MADSPSKLGKYEILGELGRGGFATVYRTRDTVLQREVALKILAPHLTWDPDFVARFKQEARISARLRHPNIVTIYEIDEVDGQLFLAMELATAGTLREHIQVHGPFTVAGTVELLGSIAAALDEAHTQGLVHRDVKPANILLDGPRAGKLRPLLTDFGLVKALSQHSELTRTGTVLGTVEYMAPEQFDVDRADEVGPRSDIYALGIVVYQMLTGQAPFSGSSAQVMYAHLHKPPVAPSAIRAELPVAVSDAILIALAKEPDDRFATAPDFAESLAAASLPPAIAQPSPVTPLPSKPSPAKLKEQSQPVDEKPTDVRSPVLTSVPIAVENEESSATPPILDRLNALFRPPSRPLMAAGRRPGFIMSLVLATMIGTALGWPLSVWVGGHLTDWRWQLPLISLGFGLIVGWRQASKLTNITIGRLFWVAATGIGVMLASILLRDLEFADQPGRYFLMLLFTLGLLQALTLWRRLDPLWAIGWAPLVAAVWVVGEALAWRALSNTEGGSLREDYAEVIGWWAIDTFTNSPIPWDTSMYIFELVGWLIRGAILGAVVGAGQGIYLAFAKGRRS